MSKTFWNLVRFTKRHAPTILSVLGSVGVIGTAVSSAKATMDVADMYADGLDPTGLDIAKTYIPTAVTAGVTIGCIMSGNAISTKQTAAMAALYAGATKTYSDYRNKVIEKKGVEFDKEVRAEITRNDPGYHRQALDCPDGKFMFVEPMTHQTFERYEREIMDAEYHFNRNFVLRGYASLSEFLYFLGIPVTPESQMIGWSVTEGFCWIDISHELLDVDVNGKSLYQITYDIEPSAEFLDGWYIDGVYKDGVPVELAESGVE